MRATTSVPLIVRGLAVVLTAGIVLAWASAGGCGSPEHFDQAAEYTPESLAQELAFRYQSLAPSARIAKKARDKSDKQGDVSRSHDEQSQVKAQTKETTKQAPAATLDDLLDEIDAKARKIQNRSRADVFQKMADAVNKDPSLEPPDRQNLSDKLKEMARAH